MYLIINKKRNVVMTDEFKELIHVRVNEGIELTI